MQKKGLGRGLDALLAENSLETTEKSGSGVTVLSISDIEPNITQVRRTFDDESLDELAVSIKEHGLIQPIVVRPKSNGFYEIVAGERRWRASKLAGLQKVPVLIREMDDTTASLIAMVENLQREDLNPVDEAFGYKSLMEKYGFTQEEAAEKVGKSRPAVANMLRLLALPQSVLELVRKGELSAGHARTIIPLVSKIPESELYKCAEKVISENLSVRDTEKLVKDILTPKAPPISKIKSEYIDRIEKKASSEFGRKITINEGTNGKGTVSLAYSGSEDLEVLLKKLCGNTFFE